MERLLELFNRLGFRERAGVVFAVLALVYVILDFSMISPEQKRVKALKAELTRIEAEATAVQADIVIVKAQLEKDPYAKDREQLDAFKKAIQEADTFLANVESDPRQVGQLLRQILATVPGLKLVSLKTLGSTPIVEKTATAQSQATVYRRGIELTVKGNYLTMLPYLEKLQQQPIRLLWGEATLTVAAYPDADLRLLFYTVSRQKAVPLG
jgi:MSHA biogenesis protein MshJ